MRVGDKAKAKNLQKLILKSRSARLLAIRQVTQLNAGKKTAGIDGKASLSFRERWELESLAMSCQIRPRTCPRSHISRKELRF